MSSDEFPPILGGFDLSDRSRYAEGFPHDVFTRLRRQEEILFHPPGKTADGEGFWVLSRYDDMVAAASDPAFSSQGGGGRAGGGTHIDDLAPGVHAGTLLNMMDDPRHQLIKEQVAPGVEGDTLAALEPDLRELADSVVAGAVAKGEGDLIRDVAGQFAIKAALRLLGVPRHDWDALLGWVDVSTGFDDREAGEDNERSQMARLALYQYGTSLLKGKQEAPAQDLMSAVGRAEIPADSGQPPLGRYEREVFFNLTLGAGTEPPRNAIALGLLALAENPDQWEALRRDRSLLPGAIEEILRWASPTPYNRRTATRDIEFRGAKIKAGDKVTFWWASANRDESVFDDPFTFDIRRAHNPHLAFGFGSHSCLGERMGRLDVRLVLEALLDRVERIRLTGPVEWAKDNKHTVILRMPVAYDGVTDVPAPAPRDLPASTLPQQPGQYIISQMLPFNPFDPAFRDDPYTVYRAIAEGGPAVRTPAGTVVVTGHREVTEALADPRNGWGDGHLVADHFAKDADGNPVRQFAFMDPPDHTRLRGLVSKAFTARVVEGLRPRAEELVAGMVAGIREAAAEGPVDLMDAVAHPLPTILLAELMGVPADNLDRFRAWSAAIGRGLDPDFMLTRDQVGQRQGGREQFNRYFTELAALRRREPADDLISALVAAEQEGDRLTESELIITCTLLISAGYALTVHLIGNGMLALLRNPDQLDWLRANPDQIAGATEELLRFDGPTQMISRLVLEDTMVGDTPVKAGETLLLVLGAAARDPRVYDDPDVLDLSRRPGVRNLGFGHGIHFCIGAPLARMTAQIALGALSRLDMELAVDDPRRNEGMVVRGLAELPVILK
ncbi:cytochrome P450 [Streptosporangium sp. NPDC050855]|uniref:cytochrome P450 n=1 Tax=Streptosporangium sp. NPDC050855 TaxID=3366194 RepID=UPI0037974F48